MSKWKTVKIKEVCEKASSNIAQKDICGNDGEYPIYGASGFIKTVDFYVQEEEYIGIVKDGAGVGRVMVLPAKSSVTGTIQYIIPNEKVLVRYLANVLTNLELGKLSSGATIPHIYFKNYENIEIPLPPLEEQKRIADILDKASNLIALRKQQLEKMDLLIKSKFIDMFGDPVTNPKGWDVKTWSSVLTIKNGKNQTKVENKNGKYPIYGSGGLMSYADDYICKENSIIIGRKGNINKPIFVKERFWNVDTAFGLESDNNMLEPIFLFHFCKKYNFEKLNKTVTIPSLTKSDLLKIQIPVPPIELQNKFATFVEQVEKQKAVMQQSLEKMETNYKALMQGYFG